MPTRTTASFDVTGWDETPYDTPDGGPRLSRVTVRKTFAGGLEGASVGEVLMCQTDPLDLSAGGGYVVSERVRGVLDGHEGAFVLQHGGVAGAGTAPRTFGHIVPGSGTGALSGLTGTIEIAVSEEGGHTLVLDYTLG